MKQVYLKTRSQWRHWLARNHDRNPGIWLVFYKKGTGKSTIEYDEAVEEALCFGWVDSIIKKLDEERYARKMTPRNDDSKWSVANMKRVARLVKQGLMTKAGLKKIEAAKKTGLYKPATPPKVSFAMPAELQQALAGNKKARDNFQQLAPSYRQHYIGWVSIAKRSETRVKRVTESLRLLEQGKKLGLK